MAVISILAMEFTGQVKEMQPGKIPKNYPTSSNFYGNIPLSREVSISAVKALTEIPMAGTIVCAIIIIRHPH